jgi:hypothetical protein
VLPLKEGTEKLITIVTIILIFNSETLSDASTNSETLSKVRTNSDFIGC